MHGNVWNWTQSRYADYPARLNSWAMVDSEDPLSVDRLAVRTFRGGSFTTLPGTIRTAYRSNSGPSSKNFGAFVGFRPARTTH